MLKLFIALFLVTILPYQLLSQTFPKEGSLLNYRIIGFSFPTVPNAGKYKIEIANGYFNNIDSFNKKIIKSIDCKTSRIIAEVPAFGSNYTWRVVNGGRRSVNSELHHFSTMMSPDVGTNIRRLRIISQAKEYKDAYVFIDGMQALYDMQGNPVWFLPESSLVTNKNRNLRRAADIKLSPQGTVTFLTNEEAREINYNGDILWKGPNTGEVSGDTSENYHHEFTRLSNGHYMVMGNETVAWKLPEYTADSVKDANIEMESNHVFYQKIRFGTVIEYDEKGKVVWSWKSSEYFKMSDLFDYKIQNGKFDGWDVHENSFFFDEKTRAVYVSCRDISRIIKVKYPEGTVMAVYGKIYKHGSKDMTNELFSGQHSVKVSQDGYLYLFNNNSTLADLPRIIMMQETAAGSDSLKKIWEYKCTSDRLSDTEQQAYNDQKKEQSIRPSHRFSSGGNVIELPDRSLFVSLNIPQSKMFIVTKNKEIIWSAVSEEKNANDSVWSPNSTYRASIIPSHKDMEQLIWNAEMKKQ